MSWPSRPSYSSSPSPGGMEDERESRENASTELVRRTRCDGEGMSASTDAGGAPSGETGRCGGSAAGRAAASASGAMPTPERGDRRAKLGGWTAAPPAAARAAACPCSDGCCEPTEATLWGMDDTDEADAREQVDAPEGRRPG